MTHSLFDPWRLIAGLSGITAVLIGAIAAHVLTDGHAVAALERASNYQLIHAVLLAVTTLMPGKAAAISRWCFLLGIILFSGSIYLKYIVGLVDATKIAPTGGLLLMLGWLCLAISAKARAQ
jgi:uncharacterized membrane protein YgdD (TMEM256/DUF423 family)